MPPISNRPLSNPTSMDVRRTASAEAVLYIHPAKQGTDFDPQANLGRPYGIIPVGVAALMNLLRENGISVRGVNISLEKTLKPDFSLKNWLASRRGVRIVLIDLHWYEHCFGAIEVARVCKQVLPWAWTILGGLTASGFASEILENFKEVDIIIRGDAEKPLLEVVQRLLRAGKPASSTLPLEDIPNLTFRREGSVVHSETIYTASNEDLDRLNFTDLDFMEHASRYWAHEYMVTDMEKARQALESRPFYGRWLCTARGCIYHCSYCGGSKQSHKTLANRSGLVVRSPERIAEDLEHLQKLGFQQAGMSYDLAVLGEVYWQKLFSLLRQREIRIGLYNEFFQLPTPEFIRDLAQTAVMPHTAVALSPLSGNERVRRMNGKHFSNEKLFDLLDVLGSHNVYLYVYFSLNLPGETEETFQETLELAEQIYDYYPRPLLKILNTAHTLDPFSPMWVFPDKFGIETQMKTFLDWYNYCRNTFHMDPAARTEQYRGFRLKNQGARSLQRMADAWDQARIGKERSWWPIPPSW